MADSWITCAKPQSAATAGYDEDANRPGVVWRLRLPTGSSREIDVVNLGQALAVELVSNDASVVPNGGFNLRKSGDLWTATIAGKKIGTTLINAGFTPPAGGMRGGPMAIAADWGPVVLQVQVTRGDGSMPGNDVGVPPEGQMDPTACWAASLAWWTRAMPSALSKTQQDLIVAGRNVVGKDGTIRKNAIHEFYASQSSLAVQTINPAKLTTFLSAGRLPMIIGFGNGPLGGHVNVIHAYDADKGTVTVMEPWFPDPSVDPNFEFNLVESTPVYSAKKDGTPFVFKGKHLVRPVAYYVSRPLAGSLIVASSSSLPSFSGD